MKTKTWISILAFSISMSALAEERRMCLDSNDEHTNACRQIAAGAGLTSASSIFNYSAIKILSGNASEIKKIESKITKTHQLQNHFIAEAVKHRSNKTHSMALMAKATDQRNLRHKLANELDGLKNQNHNLNNVIQHTRKLRNARLISKYSGYGMAAGSALMAVGVYNETANRDESTKPYELKTRKATANR